MTSAKKAKSNAKQPQLQFHHVAILRLLIQFTPLIQTSSRDFYEVCYCYTPYQYPDGVSETILILSL